MSAVMANAMERSVPFTPIPRQLPSAPVLLQLPAPVTPTINVIEETAAAITRSQGKQQEPEIPEEKSLKEKEPLKPLNKEQWKEEEELTKKMVDVVRLAQKDELLPGPRQWDERIFREGTTTKRPKYQLTSDWEGLPFNPTQPLSVADRSGEETSKNGETRQIGEQLLSTKVEVTLRQLLQFAPDVKGYIRNYMDKTIAAGYENSEPGRKQKLPGTVKEGQLSAAIAVDQQLPLITIQLGKNNITRVLLDGGSGINIMSEELRKKLGLPKPSPAPYNLRMADQSEVKPIGLFRDLTIIIQGISYVVTFTVMKTDPSAVYSLLLGRLSRPSP